MATISEEQEQFATFEGWWHDNGTKRAYGARPGGRGFAGWQAWRVWQANQAQQAGAQYEVLRRLAQEGDAKGLRDAGGTLVESFPGTL
jgi:predicted negative regulator of RcsB-dependent stress response